MRKRLVILGAGESGVGAAILGKKEGYEVYVSDEGSIKENYKRELNEYGIKWEEKQASAGKIIDHGGEVIKSPGIPENDQVIKIRAAGIPVISEIELGYRFKGAAKIAGITGSNGKTTTTSLLYHICRTGGLEVAMAGNIGYSFARQVALEPKPLYILEISSFQLDDIKNFKPDIAVLTNITEDHLDRYGYNFQNYIDSKFRITMNQDKNDDFIYSKDDKVTMENLKKYDIAANTFPITLKEELTKGVYIKDEKMAIKTDSEDISMSVYDFTLKGRHNQYNSMAAGIAGVRLGLRKDKIWEALQSFQSLEHRSEYVATVRGVEFINDSKATNVNSTWFALESMTKPVVLILGGIDKGNDYSELIELVKEKVKAIVCMGKDNRKIHEAFGKYVELIVNTDSAKEAVQAAFHFAIKGDVVLLSPACASFDLFQNYEDRGRQFKAAVMEL